MDHTSNVNNTGATGAPSDLMVYFDEDYLIADQHPHLLQQHIIF